MLPLWIPISISAAFLQNMRSALQKHLKGRLSTQGATFARFIFAAPVATAWLAVLVLGAGYTLPHPGLAFLAYGTAGGIGQILATFLLVHLFSLRNFAVGTTFSKTETIQTAAFALILLGETATFWAIAGILVSLVGVAVISLPKDGARAGRLTLDRAAWIGIGSGSLFGISAVCYRAASLSLDSGDFLIRAAMTLACVTLFQTVLMGLWMRWREPGQVRAVLAAWRVAAWVGLAGMAASLCWFMAMTLQAAAYVRALGQIELVFTLLASYLFFKERASRAELLGIGLVSGGILLLLVGG